MIQTNDFMIETPDLGKYCGDAQVLQNVELNVSRHSIFGFHRPYRGGKTALKKIMLNLIRQTNDRGLIYSLLPTIGSVGLIISHSLSCLAFIFVVLFRFENTEF